MQQVTTPTSWPSARRNAAVVAANIQCQAVDCERKATRWSNLCGLCERQFLENMKAVFGKPTSDQLKSAQRVIRDHYDKLIRAGVFDDWSSQISRAFSRPLSKLVSPMGMRRYRTPKERYTALLALRTRDRGELTKTKIINLLSFSLVIDAIITPTIPQPVRNDYMIALLGQRLMGREVYSETALRYQSRRVKTGVIRYGPDGPEALTQRIEEEVPAKEYFRIRRADMRYIGRQFWKMMEKTLLVGGRQGSEWECLKSAVMTAFLEAQTNNLNKEAA